MARFNRIHPIGIRTAGGTVDLGAALGCLRYMPRRPPGVRIECALAFSLTLDPAQTAPNAVIGVSFTGGRDAQEYVYLTPGDTIECPDGFTAFNAFNADGLDRFLDLDAQPANANLGFCAFILGLDIPGARVTLAANPGPDARIIQTGMVPLYDGAVINNIPGLFFAPGACRKVRVTPIGLTAVGGIQASSRVSAALTMGWLSHYLYNEVPPFPLEEQTIDNPRVATIAATPAAFAVPETVHWGSSTADSSGLDGPSIIFDVPPGALMGSLWRGAIWQNGTVTQLGAIIEGIR